MYIHSKNSLKNIINKIKQTSNIFAFVKKEDLFYSDSNMKALDEATEQYKNGKVVTKTIEELEGMVKL